MPSYIESYQSLGEGSFRCFEKANRRVSVDEEMCLSCDVAVQIGGLSHSVCPVAGRLRDFVLCLLPSQS